jgi:OOP family OmpA-OmpF porin
MLVELAPLAEPIINKWTINMNVKKKLTTNLIAGASVAMATMFAGNVLAMDTFAQDSAAAKVMNSAGGCWMSADGVSGLCGGPMDSDGDGVTDDMDKCPDTMKGVKVDASGCPLDSDGDGIPDSMDKCPGTPKGVSVDMMGCPLDSDGDGVADYMDKCPGTPKGAEVDSDGCMEKLTLQNVNFATDSAELTMEARGILTPIANVLKGRPDVKGLNVVGHTDNTGSDAYNKKLSQARAEAVAGFFKAVGVKAAMSASGMGESEPVADNGTEQGRYQNRRVELSVQK